jgi:uncharacterized C2H2 Zn-finger protein
MSYTHSVRRKGSLHLFESTTLEILWRNWGPRMSGSVVKIEKLVRDGNATPSWSVEGAVMCLHLVAVWIVRHYTFFCSCFSADFPESQLDVCWTSLNFGHQFHLSTQDLTAATAGSDDSVHLYACPRCTKRYKFRTSLYRHLKFECGKKPSFHCPHCPYMTKQKAPMKRHIRHTHGINI